MKVLKYIVAALPFCLCACSDDDKNTENTLPDNLVELQLDTREINIAQGDSRTVKITAGNGEYAVTSVNEEVVTATIQDNVITLTAVANANSAQGVVVVSDKYYQRGYIKVNTAAEFDLKLSKNIATLYSEVEDADEITIKIYTGNGGYNLEVIDEDQCIRVDQSTLEETESFTIKGIAEGDAQVKVTDQKGKETYVTLKVIAPIRITTNADESGVLIEANQGKEQVKILTGNGDYKIYEVGDPKIVNVEIWQTTITVTGRKAGETYFTLIDSKKQISERINVKIAPDKRWGMTLGKDYFVWAHFNDMKGEGVAALKQETNNFKLKKMTWELTCKITGTNWLQTFMGKEGYFILRGSGDNDNKARKIDLIGTGDKLKLQTKGSFELDKWMHLALVVDCEQPQSEPGKKYKLYLNGELQEWQVNKNDLDFSEINLTAGNDNGTIEIGRASNDHRRCLNGSILEARIWSVCRTPEQIKANMWTFGETVSTGLLTRWDFSAGAETSYIEDVNGADYELPMNISKTDNGGKFTTVNFPLDRFEEVPVVVPFR
ncbi:LamG-like jellyroll fold domain-containing protein [Bacteroides sp. 224]|uniref:LamG-like jellyroll fold domain-containing protein n=1 Tax=Bacteroides sp. 224 TaxID=2302936 RepID=UPI001940333A|nr:LamG-like jellyroll fold domain-containing protein [Bacteroides sp. 224]NDV63673.1 hypothetical protein [Bacteroides sp. 224]